MKSYLDYGAFTPIQVAATAALNGPQDCVAEMRALYRERRDVLIRGLHAAGWDVPSPDGSMFAWAPIPPRFAHLGSLEFSKLLLARARWRWPRASASASMATGMCASRWSRTRTGCGRRCATSARSCRPTTPARPRRRSRRATGRREMTRPLNVALAGLGTVGAGVLKLLRENADLVAARAGRPIAVTAVSARDRTRDRGISLAGLRWFDDPVALAADPVVDVVVEADRRRRRDSARAGAGRNCRDKAGGDGEQGAARGAWR